jgi:hypothetical protein
LTMSPWIRISASSSSMARSKVSRGEIDAIFSSPSC